MDPHSRAPEKNTSHGNEVLPQNILHISYKDHVTNDEVHAKIQQVIGPQEDLLMIVKSRKLHQGMDRPGVWQVPEGSGEQGKMEKTGCKIIFGAPTTLAVKGLMMMMT